MYSAAIQNVIQGLTRKCIALLYKIVRRVESHMRRWIRNRNDVTSNYKRQIELWRWMDGGTNVMITYDAIKMDGTYSDGISSITPLFYQIFMNI